ncbi:hypothetical protein B0H13DRAFT_1163672 [Mycena leptocephala]|nr:hypothetical protein B0H13DRAFT_1163672 [Mycena leptocephala]
MIPFCCWRYRPTKVFDYIFSFVVIILIPNQAYFMYTIKWAVLQYVIVRPAVSIAGIVCQAFNVLCESESFSVKYANVYLEAVDFASIRSPPP